MKTKLIKRADLYEYPMVIHGAEYAQNHVYLQGGKYVIFAGEIGKGSHTECVIHNPNSLDILCLQIILSYGQKVKYRLPLLRVMTLLPNIKMEEMCELLHCSRQFIHAHLSLPEWFDERMPLANAQYLHRVKEPTALLKLQAILVSPSEFGPMCCQIIKDQRKPRK